MTEHMAEWYRWRGPAQIACLGTLNDPTLGYWLKALIEAGVGPLVVIVDSKQLPEADVARWHDRTQGRMAPIDLAAFSEIPFHFVTSHNAVDCVALIKRLNVSISLNCGTPRILKGDILSAPPSGVFGVHPGKLPDYRGCSCVEWALFNRDPIYNSVFKLTDAIDYGPILAFEQVGLEGARDYADIRVKVLTDGARLLATAINDLLHDRRSLTELPFDADGRYWPPMPQEVLDQVLAMAPQCTVRVAP